MLGSSYKCTCNFSIGLLRWQGGVRVPLVVSLLGCWDTGKNVEVSSRRLINILLLLPSLSHERVSSLSIPLPRSLRFLDINIRRQIPPAPHFADHRSTTSTFCLLFNHITLLGGTSQGRPDPSRDPRRRQRFLPPPPTLFPAGVIFCTTHPPVRNPSTPPGSLGLLGFRLITELGSWRLVTFCVFFPPLLDS